MHNKRQISCRSS